MLGWMRDCCDMLWVLLLASRGADDVLVPFTACSPPASHHLGLTQASWAQQHSKLSCSSSHRPAVALRNELPSTTLLIPVSGKASGSCWRTKKYGYTQNSVTQAERNCCKQDLGLSSNGSKQPPLPLSFQSQT